MILDVLSDRDELRQAFEQLQQRWAEGAIPLQRAVGWQGGGGTFTVGWRPDERMWAVLGESTAEGRYWCGFGTQDATGTKLLTPVCELNPPTSGINKHLGGQFVRDYMGPIYFATTGNVGGGRAGVGKTAFTAWYGKEKLQRASCADGTRLNVFPIGRLDAFTLLRQIADFVRAVEDFKQSAVKAAR